MIKIITDSSCDKDLLTNIENLTFKRVPLKVTIGNDDYIDSSDLDINLMMENMESFKGKTGSSCPSPDDWVDAARDADEIYMITISSGMSGSFNSANVAKDMILEEFPDKKVTILDSLGTSGSTQLIAEKIIELVKDGNSFEHISKIASEYISKIKLNFALFSIDNLVKNGRVGKIVGIAANAFNISLVGVADDTGHIGVVDKARGVSKSINSLVKQMKENGYNGGKIIIGHCLNEENANKLKEKIKETFSVIKNIEINQLSGLCSYYAERNGLILAYEI